MIEPPHIFMNIAISFLSPANSAKTEDYPLKMINTGSNYAENDVFDIKKRRAAQYNRICFNHNRTTHKSRQ